jgi:hypothetical protein
MLQRKCGCGAHSNGAEQCEACRNNQQRTLLPFASRHDDIGSIARNVRPAPATSGQPLDENSQARFEQALGIDLSGVKIHTDQSATRSTRELGARAYTVGHNIVFDAEHYAPETTAGRRLMAHELTHVVQQRHAQDTPGERFSKPGDQHEKEANRIADTIIAGGRAPTIGSAEHTAIMRDGDTDPVWGGFRIHSSDDAYIRSVRADLGRIDSTSTGHRLLQEIEANRSGPFTFRIGIRPDANCWFSDYFGGIYYNAADCGVANDCPGHPGPDWAANIPNYVYLYHEIAHAYIHHVLGVRGRNECRATGLGIFATYIPYNENRLRCELNLPVRPCYPPDCRGYAAPTCAQIATREQAEAAHRRRQLRIVRQGLHDRQLECVIRLGGCPSTRPGGLPTEGEIQEYNERCRSESDYQGPILTPSDDDCGGGGS